LKRSLAITEEEKQRKEEERKKEEEEAQKTKEELEKERYERYLQNLILSEVGQTVSALDDYILQTKKGYKAMALANENDLFKEAYAVPTGHSLPGRKLHAVKGSVQID